jgi:mono/diheme cytochrome c family protein
MCETFLCTMSNPPKRSRALPQAMFLLILAIIVAAILYSAFNGAPWSWPVPEEAKQLKNPLQPTEPALKSAREVYVDKCAHCHGDTGKGDGRDAARYDPAPADFTDAKRMSAVTDGELFYKISEGKKPMPVFKTKLSEDQRWELVLLVRSFAESAAASGKGTVARDDQPIRATPELISRQYCYGDAEVFSVWLKLRMRYANRRRSTIILDKDIGKVWYSTKVARDKEELAAEKYESDPNVDWLFSDKDQLPALPDAHSPGPGFAILRAGETFESDMDTPVVVLYPNARDITGFIRSEFTSRSLTFPPGIALRKLLNLGSCGRNSELSSRE